MKLPLGFGELDFGDWLYGLFSGFISGGATAIVATFGVSAVDPANVNLQHPSIFFSIMGIIFLISGVTSAANFLTKRPLPERKQVTNSQQTTVLKTKTARPTKVVTTHTETHSEPLGHETFAQSAEKHQDLERFHGRRTDRKSPAKTGDAGVSSAGDKRQTR